VKAVKAEVVLESHDHDQPDTHAQRQAKYIDERKQLVFR
jgi:hypothetical protein